MINTIAEVASVLYIAVFFTFI